MKATKKELTPKETAAGCLIGIVIMLAILGYCSLTGSDTPADPPEWEETGPEEPQSARSFTKEDAVVFSQAYLKEYLKSPSTAEFPAVGPNTDMAARLNDSTFVVQSYVDSQNGFGAMIRTRYSCKIIFDSEGNYYCEDLATSD